MKYESLGKTCKIFVQHWTPYENIIVAEASVPGDPPWSYVQVQKRHRQFVLPEANNNLESFRRLRDYETLDPGEPLQVSQKNIKFHKLSYS